MPPPKQPASRTVPRPAPELRPAPPRTTPPDVVDPIWLLKALALSMVAAIFCAWLAVCLLVYQGAWQLVLHPSHTVDTTPGSAHIPFELIHFDSADTGQPRLTAWWVAAAPSAKYSAYTVLYLHNGSLSLAATVPAIARLHATGLNVFALDYQGFGLNDPAVHPNEARMAQDTAAALEYLTAVRHIPSAQIIPYGTGLGASLAANLALANAAIPAVILDNPDPDPTSTAIAARPYRVIPIRLLFHERFDIATPIATLTTPKLLIVGGPNSTNGTVDIHAVQLLFRRAASPSFTVTLPPINYDSTYQSSLTRFLDQYLHP